MAEKVLIIGNGFDLAHNLPTNYMDFLTFSNEFMNLYREDYVVLSREDEFQLQAYLDDQIGELALRRSDDPTEDDADRISIDRGILDQMHDNLKDNVWFYYFLNLVQKELTNGRNWIDFESEISFVIQEIDRCTVDMDASFDYVFQNLSKESGNPEMFSFIQLIDKTGKHEFIKNHSVNEFSNILFEDLSRLTEALEIYLAYFIDNNTTAYGTQKLPLIESLQPDHVLSFNYTHTFQNLYGQDSRPECCFIHGECRKIDSGRKQFEKRETNLVLGIDEYLHGTERDNNNRFFIFKKFVQRIRNHNDTSYRDWVNKQEESRDIIDVYIYGHSLDITDRDILQLFLLPDNANIHVFAKDKVAEGNLINNLIRIIGEDKVIEKSTRHPSGLEIIRLE